MKKRATGRSVEQFATDQAVSRKLLQLNFHRALAHNFRGYQILDDLRLKRQNDSIFGRAFIAESAIRLNEALFGSCFHVNALTAGENTGLFAHLDKLKARINAVIDAPETGPAPDDDAMRGEDEVTRLLAGIITETCDVGPPPCAAPRQDLPERPTASEMLAYLSRLTLEVAESRFGKAAGQGDGSADPVTAMPVNYVQLLEAHEPSRAGDPAGTTGLEAAQLLAEGIRETAGSMQADDKRQPSGPEPDLRAVVVHSPNAVTLSAASRLFRCAMGAAVFDDVAGNYIYLIIAPCGPEVRTAVSRLLLRSLYWLDFDTTDSPQVICAGIKNLTREEMGDHLNMLGKLLSFASVRGKDLEGDESVQDSVQYFLENVI